MALRWIKYIIRGYTLGSFNDISEGMSPSEVINIAEPKVMKSSEGDD